MPRFRCFRSVILAVSPKFIGSFSAPEDLTSLWHIDPLRAVPKRAAQRASFASSTSLSGITLAPSRNRVDDAGGHSDDEAAFGTGDAKVSADLRAVVCERLGRGAHVAFPVAAVLHAYDRTDVLSDPFGCGLDAAIPEMGVAKRRAPLEWPSSRDTTGTGTPLITAWLA